jgi:polyprenyl P-hydroxybenzoate/phenylacrylic acid decarboxylase-like protein
MTQEGEMSTKRLVVGITGSSAPQLAITLLTVVRDLPEVEVHLVVSRGAEKSILLETGKKRGEVEALADRVYDPEDLAAPISSGSFPVDGMVIVPCSMNTLASVAAGISDNLIARAADVSLKERRRLVLVTRETPLSLIHIRNMETVTLAGATVLPPVPAFYHKPETIEDLLRHTAGKVLDQFGIPHNAFKRWG